MMEEGIMEEFVTCGRGHVQESYEWRDCDKVDHEEWCYVASCRDKNCSWQSYDCEEVAQ